MHICDYGVGVEISIIYTCILKFKSNIHQSNINTFHYAANKFLQSGLEGNKYNYNKSLNHATLKHAVHYVTLQNTELAIYQDNIQLPQIKIKFYEECTYNTNKYLPYLKYVLLGQEIINLGPVAPGGIVRNSEESMASKILLTIVDKENVGILAYGFQTS